MAQATVKTVQFLDPRIEPQPDPVYDYVIGPTQNQFYKIPASGLSDSSLTFNNLTTLGVDRAYLDTFEIELHCQFTFNLGKTTAADELGNIGVRDFTSADAANVEIIPRPDEWTFQSFPFNTCCDEARVNINGGAFFSQPMCYVRAKERYMNQRELSRCYENICPVHKPLCQTESGRDYNLAYGTGSGDKNFLYGAAAVDDYRALPSRYGAAMFNMMQSQEGMDGGFNNSIVTLGEYDSTTKFYKNVRLTGTKGETCIIDVTWREPIFVSPFSSRYDATYGRPLYNITSLDFTFNLQNLGNMIRLSSLNIENLEPSSSANDIVVKNYSVHIVSAQLCYQVMTIPALVQKPLTTLVPYRRFVPYITDINQALASVSQPLSQTSVKKMDMNGVKQVTITSGVYTLNEIPTAIWIFAAPTKATYQRNDPDTWENTPALFNGRIKALSYTNFPNWESNKLFAFLKHVDITLANTTQILNTATTYDLYRIAKANGCEDSYLSWAGDDVMMPKLTTGTRNILYTHPSSGDDQYDDRPLPTMYLGAGSVLRLKPGVDLIVPDIPLIPGANANNMVLQVTATFDIPPHSPNLSEYSLWLLFEYVGVAAISPGQCEITMNPLGSGEIMGVSPVVSATSESTEGQLEGSGGFWDKVKRSARIAGQIGESGAISRILKQIPGGKPAAAWAEKHGLGEPARKRVRGGAVVGHGLNDWV